MSCCMSCQNIDDKKEQKLETYDNVPKQIIETRDEQYILFTVEQFIKQHFYTFGYYNDYDHIGLKLEDVKIEVERIFYSPDKLKMVAWIFYTVPNNKDYARKDQNYYYNAEALVGFRENPSTTWLIYPFDEFSANGSGTKDWLHNQMGQYYFEKMAKDGEYVNENYLDENYGGKIDYDEENRKKRKGTALETPFVMKEFGYNINDVEFWNKSLVWQKGARIPNYYNFQTNGNVTLTHKEPLRKLPVIEYPKEILRQYE